MSRSNIVQSLLTDLYQLTMAYSYWKANKTSEPAVFHLFFRKNPFKGEFTIFAGLSDCLTFLDNFHYTEEDLSYLRTVMPNCEEEFFVYLSTLRTSDIEVSALAEGSVCFPRVPLIKVTGPLILVQLCESIFLNLVNFASLVATNAARFRIAAGTKVKLYEFGLRRAQGPDGGLSASKYSYLGGFDGSSNVLAGKMFGLPVTGTHSHAYVSSFCGLEEVTKCKLQPHITPINTNIAMMESDNWANICIQWRTKVANIFGVMEAEVNEGELAAFISYASAFPSSFLALIDTYDVMKSGVVNFCAVALALDQYGFQAVGVRIDSGDLAYLSNKVREVFSKIGEVQALTYFAKLEIIASNDINEETILSLNDQGHSISCYGIGTHLVTCQRQPALGCVYKLVSIASVPRMKISQDIEKITMPGEKEAYRLYGRDGLAILDLLQLPEEPPPKLGEKVLCRHPFQESKRAWVTPHRVEKLHNKVWSEGRRLGHLDGLEEIKNRVVKSMETLRPDHARSHNPCPYKVSVSEKLYTYVHSLWLENAPIGELS